MAHSKHVSNKKISAHFSLLMIDGQLNGLSLHTYSTNMSRKRKEEENRSFDDQWIENYLFYENRKGLQSCIVCGYSCPVNKEYHVRRHYDTTHAGKDGELAGRERSEKVSGGIEAAARRVKGFSAGK